MAVVKMVKIFIICYGGIRMEGNLTWMAVVRNLFICL